MTGVGCGGVAEALRRGDVVDVAAHGPLAELATALVDDVAFGGLGVDVEDLGLVSIGMWLMLLTVQMN